MAQYPIAFGSFLIERERVTTVCGSAPSFVQGEASRKDTT
jgi:hypothetical protein